MLLLITYSRFKKKKKKTSVPILKIWIWRYELFPKVSSWWRYWRGMVYEDSVFNNRLSPTVFIVWGPDGVAVESRRWSGISWGASYAPCPMFCLIHNTEQGRTHWKLSNMDELCLSSLRLFSQVFSQGNNTHSHTDWHVTVHGGTICKAFNVKTASECVGKGRAVPHTYNGRLLNSKRNQSVRLC